MCSRLDDRVGVVEAAQHAHVLQIGAGNVETNGHAAGSDEQCVVVLRLATLESYRLRARVNTRDFFFEDEIDVVLFEKVFTAKRHPLRLSMALQIVFTEIGPIVRRAVFARDHNDVSNETLFAQSLRRSVTGCDRTDDHELSRIDGGVAPRHRGRASIFCVFRQTHEEPFAFDAQVVSNECVERGRIFKITVDDVEGGVMPRAYDARTAEDTFSEWSTVVRTSRTDRVKVITNTRQQNLSFVDRDFFHLAVAEVESICELNFFKAHCRLSGHANEVAHLLLLGLEVLGGGGGRRGGERRTLDDFESCLSQRLDLRGGVRHHTL